MVGIDRFADDWPQADAQVPSLIVTVVRPAGSHRRVSGGTAGSDRGRIAAEQVAVRIVDCRRNPALEQGGQRRAERGR